MRSRSAKRHDYIEDRLFEPALDVVSDNALMACRRKSPDTGDECHAALVWTYLPKLYSADTEDLEAEVSGGWRQDWCAGSGAEVAYLGVRETSSCLLGLSGSSKRRRLMTNWFQAQVDAYNIDGADGDE